MTTIRTRVGVGLAFAALLLALLLVIAIRDRMLDLPPRPAEAVSNEETGRGRTPPISGSGPTQHDGPPAPPEKRASTLRTGPPDVDATVLCPAEDVIGPGVVVGVDALDPLDGLVVQNFGGVMVLPRTGARSVKVRFQGTGSRAFWVSEHGDCEPVETAPTVAVSGVVLGAPSTLRLMVVGCEDSTYTENDGSFLLADAIPGDCLLRVLGCDSEVLAEKQLLLEAGEDTLDLSLSLAKAPCAEPRRSEIPVELETALCALRAADELLGSIGSAQIPTEAPQFEAATRLRYQGYDLDSARCQTLLASLKSDPN